MEIEIDINGERREYTRAEEDWIRAQISRLGAGVEIILYLTGQDLNLALSHPSNAVDKDESVGHGRLLPGDQEIWEKWQEFGLDGERLDLTMLLNFLHELKP